MPLLIVATVLSASQGLPGWNGAPGSLDARVAKLESWIARVPKDDRVAHRNAKLRAGKRTGKPPWAKEAKGWTKKNKGKTVYYGVAWWSEEYGRGPQVVVSPNLKGPDDGQEGKKNKKITKGEILRVAEMYAWGFAADLAKKDGHKDMRPLMVDWYVEPSGKIWALAAWAEGIPVDVHPGLHVEALSIR